VLSWNNQLKKVRIKKMENSYIPLKKVLETDGTITNISSLELHENYNFHRVRTKLSKNAFRCPVCETKLALSKNGATPYFRHYRDSEAKKTCQHYTDNKLTIDEINALKFADNKEGERHKRLKKFIFNSINNDNRFINTQLEKAINRKGIEPIDTWRKGNYRRPDISTNKDGKILAIELQLASQAVKTIVERTEFFRSEGGNVLWIFGIEKYIQDKKTSEKDIHYMNNFNSFVLNDEAEKKTNKKGELILECFYHKPVFNKSKHIVEPSKVWYQKFIKVAKLTINKKGVYYYDYISEAKKLHSEKCFVEKETSYGNYMHVCKAGIDTYRIYQSKDKTNYSIQLNGKYINTIKGKEHLRSSFRSLDEAKLSVSELIINI
jgi:competence CoiA-like predicted nuclease